MDAFLSLPIGCGTVFVHYLVQIVVLYCWCWPVPGLCLYSFKLKLCVQNSFTLLSIKPCSSTTTLPLPHHPLPGLIAIPWQPLYSNGVTNPTLHNTLCLTED